MCIIQNNVKKNKNNFPTSFPASHVSLLCWKTRIHSLSFLPQKSSTPKSTRQFLCFSFFLFLASSCVYFNCLIIIIVIIILIRACLTVTQISHLIGTINYLFISNVSLIFFFFFLQFNFICFLLFFIFSFTCLTVNQQFFLFIQVGTWVVYLVEKNRIGDNPSFRKIAKAKIIINSMINSSHVFLHSIFVIKIIKIMDNFYSFSFSRIHFTFTTFFLLLFLFLNIPFDYKKKKKNICFYQTVDDLQFRWFN